ncbi:MULTISPECIES: hypothetical protein [Trichococcus]|nr:hypothetical protein [Trichococcus shcherbakoviae]
MKMINNKVIYLALISIGFGSLIFGFLGANQMVELLDSSQNVATIKMPLYSSISSGLSFTATIVGALTMIIKKQWKWLPSLVLFHVGVIIYSLKHLFIKNKKESVA